MYYSPIPTLLIRADSPSLIEINGRAAGECSACAHLSLPVADTGVYYIGAHPLESGPAERLYGVLRKVSLEHGSIVSPPASDVDILEWPGGIYEVTLHPGRLECAEKCSVPRVLDSISPVFEGRKYDLTLYLDGGVRLSVSERGMALTGFSLGCGDSGSLDVRRFGDRPYVAVRACGGAKERLVLLDASLEPALDIADESIAIEGERIYAIGATGAISGRERRIAYEAVDGGFAALPPEYGFFTRERRAPGNDMERAVAFAEAVRDGLEQEAIALVSPALAASLRFEDIRGFLGEFTLARPPLSDGSGRYLGLISERSGRARVARLFELEFEGGLISNMKEA